MNGLFLNPIEILTLNRNSIGIYNLFREVISTYKKGGHAYFNL